MIRQASDSICITSGKTLSIIDTVEIRKRVLNVQNRCVVLFLPSNLSSLVFDRFSEQSIVCYNDSQYSLLV